MVPRRGTRDNENPPDGLRRLVSATGQFVAFCLLVVMAMAVFGAVVLLPEYARLQNTWHQLAQHEATTADERSLIEGTKRLVATGAEDTVLTKRLAMNELGLWPTDEVVVISDRGPRAQSPARVTIQRAPRPEPPSGWFMTAAERVANPPTRRGLLLIAVVGLVAAVILFPGGDRRRNTKAPGPVRQ